MKHVISCEIGMRIRKLRISKGKTMTDLAHDCDMEYIQLSRIERGKINTTVFQLYKIAQSLKIELKEIFEKFEKDINLKFEHVKVDNNIIKNSK